MIMQSTREATREELIQRINELQLEIEKLKKKHKIICGLNVELLENIENFIPKQVLRNRIADLEEVKSKYNFLIGTSYRADGAINTLKELLGDE